VGRGETLYQGGEGKPVVEVGRQGERTMQEGDRCGVVKREGGHSVGEKRQHGRMHMCEIGYESWSGGDGPPFCQRGIQYTKVQSSMGTPHKRVKGCHEKKKTRKPPGSPGCTGGGRLTKKSYEALGQRKTQLPEQIPHPSGHSPDIPGGARGGGGVEGEGGGAGGSGAGGGGEGVSGEGGEGSQSSGIGVS